MAHPDPDDKASDLQHIGFYAMPGGKPIRNMAIPDFFRLAEVGAGVFIMGFNPRTADWVNGVTSAVIENFFYAIHHKRLVVKIDPKGSDGTVVNHETLDWLFERVKGYDKPAYHYYKAIRDQKAVPTDAIGKIGVLNVHLSFDSGPRCRSSTRH